MSSLAAFFLRHRLVALLISAALAALPLNIDLLWPLSWIAEAPLFCVLCSLYSPKRAFRYGFLCQFIYFTFIYWWFIALYPLDFAGFSDGESRLVILAAWLGISLVQALVTSIFAPLFVILTRKLGGYCFKAVVFASLACICEWLTDFTEFAFPWSKISLAQYRNLPILQLSSLGGQLAVSFLIYFTGAMLGALLLKRRRRKSINHELSVLTSVIAAAIALGTLLLMKPVEEGKTISAAIIQGNIQVSEKWSGDDTIQIYSALTREAEKTDLIVWPETAVSRNLDRHPLLGEYYKQLSESLNTPIFMGCLKESDGRAQNAALLVDGDEISDAYIKQALVPFGEFMPFQWLFSKIPALSRFNLDGGNYIAGESGKLIDFDGIALAPIICFDSIHPALAAEECKNGGEIIMLVTNDSWYKDYPAVRQHLAAAAYRAAENGKYLIRAANSGISAVFTPKGEITAELGALEMGILYGNVAEISETTLYSRTGDIIVYLFFALVIAAAAASIIKHKRNLKGNANELKKN